MTTPVFIGIDLGTTSAKAVAVGIDGTVVASSSRPYPTHRPSSGRVEQDPRDWLAAIDHVAREVLAAPDIEPIAVGFTSQVNTHVLVDANLEPLVPAITWQDQRCARVAAQLSDELGPQGILDRWGGPFAIDASFSLSRYRWWQEHEPDAVARARHLVVPKDFCLAHLTGHVITDPVSPVGLVGPDGHYIDGVVEIADGFRELLPEIRPLDASAGTSAAVFGLPSGLPVAVGTMDALGAIIGSGVVDPGDAFQISGTSEVVGLLADQPAGAEGIISFPPLGDTYILVGPTQAGGDALRWVADLVGTDVGSALDLAHDSWLSGPTPLLFLPHLAGERAPVWNPDARGVWFGLTSETTPGDLVLSVLEGVAFSARRIMQRCRDAVEALPGVPEPNRIRLSGGASTSQLWNQIKVTTLGLRGEVVASPASGAVGAAMCGAAAHGGFGTLDQLSRTLVKVDHVVDPDPALAARLDDLYDQYVDLYDALTPAFTRLAATVD